MAIVTDFLAAINQIAAERGIDADKVYEALKQAILIAYKKEYLKRDFFKNEEEEVVEEDENFSVELDRENGGFRIVARKTVVKKVEDSDKEIDLEEAQLISPDLKEGDIVEVEMPSDDFGRIAAQTAKQVILQQIRESEKEAVLSEFSDKVGEVFSALMQRMQRGDVVFEIGKATAFMRPEEQIPNEFYKVGERYKVVLLDIEDSIRGKELVVSRGSSELLIKLFEMEVPEIESGVVEVKAVAREPGSRSKMAVVSHQNGVDPIGSCVGQRGIRIANVMSELGEEKIDIIEWDEDIETFIANALSPAQVENVKVTGDTAIVKVAEDQLSLAIGRDGQNVRLAWKLTDKRIDIVGPDGKAKKPEDLGKIKVEEAETDEKAVEVDEKKEGAVEDEKAVESKDKKEESVEKEAKEEVIEEKKEEKKEVESKKKEKENIKDDAEEATEEK